MQNERLSSVASKRRMDVDILKGIGIILVLIGHSFQHGLHFNIIYSFHMPLFFIVAGYFFKKRSIISGLKKDFERLLVPYYFIIILIIILSMVYSYCGIETIKTEDSIKMLYNHDVGAIWFLAALFWSKQLFNIMQYVTENKCYLFLISLLLMIGIVTFKNNYGQLPYSSFFFQGISGVVFVSIGYIAKDFDLINLLKPMWRKLLLGFISIAWIISSLGEPLNMMRFEYHNYVFLDVLYASVATYLCYIISYFIATKNNIFSRFFYIYGCLFYGDIVLGTN